MRVTVQLGSARRPWAARPSRSHWRSPRRPPPPLWESLSALRPRSLGHEGRVAGSRRRPDRRGAQYWRAVERGFDSAGGNRREHKVPGQRALGGILTLGFPRFFPRGPAGVSGSSLGSIWRRYGRRSLLSCRRGTNGRAGLPARLALRESVLLWGRRRAPTSRAQQAGRRSVCVTGS